MLYDDDQLIYGITGFSMSVALQNVLVELEGATNVTLYFSGLAAITGAMLVVLKAGDEVLVVDSAYKFICWFCDRVLGRFGVMTRYYDPKFLPEVLMGLVILSICLIVLEAPGSLTFEM